MECASVGRVEEVAWQLGHRSSTVTRTVYVQEVKNAERTARRRARMEVQYGDLLLAVEGGMQGAQSSARQSGSR